MFHMIDMLPVEEARHRSRLESTNARITWTAGRCKAGLEKVRHLLCKLQFVICALLFAE